MTTSEPRSSDTKTNTHLCTLCFFDFHFLATEKLPLKEKCLIIERVATGMMVFPKILGDDDKDKAKENEKIQPEVIGRFLFLFL